jgi:hypothetical protein
MTAFAAAVKVSLTMRGSIHKKRCFYAAAVTLLAIGLFAQAVHAKNADYFPTAPHSTRYSTTIKIADLVRHVVVDHGTIAVLSEVPPVAPPQVTFVSRTPEFRIHELSAQISFRPRRSPPVNS